jgi:hypothetical protein
VHPHEPGNSQDQRRHSEAHKGVVAHQRRQITGPSPIEKQGDRSAR